MSSYGVSRKSRRQFFLLNTGYICLFQPPVPVTYRVSVVIGPDHHCQDNGRGSDLWYGQEEYSLDV